MRNDGDGDGASAATTLQYYRSADATISSSDTEVGTDAVEALAHRGSQLASVAPRGIGGAKTGGESLGAKVVRLNQYR